MERLCSQFGFGRTGLHYYQGSVLLDDQALYLVASINVNFMGLGGLGGAIGGAIVGGIAAAMGGPSGLPFETTFSALDEKVKQQPAWGRIADHVRVLVVPKTATQSVALSVWTGCSVKTAKVTIYPSIPFYKTRRAREVFQRYGWPISS